MIEYRSLRTMSSCYDEHDDTIRAELTFLFHPSVYRHPAWILLHTYSRPHEGCSSISFPSGYLNFQGLYSPVMFLLQLSDGDLLSLNLRFQFPCALF